MTRLTVEFLALKDLPAEFRRAEPAWSWSLKPAQRGPLKPIRPLC